MGSHKWCYSRCHHSNNRFKNSNLLHHAIPVLRFHAGHTHDFLDRDGFQSNSHDFCYNTKFKKIRVIEILNYKVGETSNQSSFQSQFIKEIVGLMDGSFQIHAIHTPTSTTVIEIPVTFIDFDIAPIIIAAISNNAIIIELDDHYKAVQYKKAKSGAIA